MADGETLKTVAKRRKNNEVGCDIDNGDGTVDDHKQDIDDQRESGTRLSGNKTENHRSTMKVTMTDTKVKEMIDKVQEYGGVMTSDQLQTMIEGIQGKTGGARSTRTWERGWVVW